MTPPGCRTGSVRDSQPLPAKRAEAPGAVRAAASGAPTAPRPPVRGLVVPVVPPAASDPCGGAVTVSSRCSAPLTAAQEQALKPKDSFKECAQCPEMVVVPVGSFTIWSPANEKGRAKDEGPQHTVTIGKPFAVGKFHVTVDQFAAFVAATGYDAGSKCWTIEGGSRKSVPAVRGAIPVLHRPARIRRCV
jgi:formylglycine-generating enzyme required for sulfatase activity